MAAALSGAKLLAGARDVFISWEPVKPGELECWTALSAAIAAACPNACAVCNEFPFMRRVEAVEHVTGRNIVEEALQEVAGDCPTARYEAQLFGTSLQREAFTLQSKLMRDVTKDFLRSEACANSKEPMPTAYIQFMVSNAIAGGWFVEEALWMAIYGVSFCVMPVAVKEEVPPAAAAGNERRQQEQQQRQQQRRQRRRRRSERARQQHRQQRLQQARDAAAALPADLAAGAPDVSGMRVAQLKEFLQELGVPAGTTSSSSRQQLLSLATSCLQLWEAKRLVRCGSHMPPLVRGLATPAHEALARAVLRLAPSSSASSRHRSRVAEAEVNRHFKDLGRAVHPDKCPIALRGCGDAVVAFTEGFKVLQNAKDLLLGCCN